MTIARAEIVDPDTPLFYHLVSRCVRRSWLCGFDHLSQTDFSHRRRWLIDRMHHLARFFAVQVHAYAIMSNHFHLVVFFDPTASRQWSHHEIIRRWCGAFPPLRDGQLDQERLRALREALLNDLACGRLERIERLRAVLGSMSQFMKHLKQPISLRANREDRCKGHFFEGRFYSGALLDEQSVLAAMAYVDLNPLRAKVARCIEQCADTSIEKRLQCLANHPDRLAKAMHPLVSGLEHDQDQRDELDPSLSSQPCDERPFALALTLDDYLEHLQTVIADLRGEPLRTDTARDWVASVKALARHQHAYGSDERLAAWYGKRGFRLPARQA